MDVTSYALTKKVAASAVSGVANMYVDDTTLNINTNDGQELKVEFPTPKDGVSIIDVDIDSSNKLTVTLSDGTIVNGGTIATIQGERGKQGDVGENGKDGKSAYEVAVLSGYVGTEQEWIDSLKGESPVISENAENIGDVYKLDITSPDGTVFTTPNLKGAGGTEYFDYPEKTFTTVGGLKSGSDIYGKTTKEVLESILYPYIPPAITLKISPNSIVYEKGQSLNNITLTPTVEKKSNDITSIKLYFNETLLHDFVEDIKNGGTFSFEYAPETPIVSTGVFKVVANDGKQNTEVKQVIKFVSPSYYGYISNDTELSEDIIVNLNTVLKDTKEFSYTNATFTDSCFCYAYPKEFGLLDEIMDKNGFDYLDSYEMSVLQLNGVDYYIYKLKNSTTVNNFTQIYK